MERYAKSWRTIKEALTSSGRTGMLHGEWCLNTKTGRFLRMEVREGFTGKRDNVCKGTELSDGRKSSGDPFRLPCSRQHG